MAGLGYLLSMLVLCVLDRKKSATELAVLCDTRKIAFF